MVEDDTIVTVVALGAGVFLVSKVMNAGSGPGEAVGSIGGFLDGVANGGGEIVNEIFGGTADVADRLNPFTSGPVIPGVELW
jgi:hypothetical protein